MFRPKSFMRVKIKGSDGVFEVMGNTVMDLKNEIEAKTQCKAQDQRLIYSGKILKDEDDLTVYKLAEGHTYSSLI